MRWRLLLPFPYRLLFPEPFGPAIVQKTGFSFAAGGTNGRLIYFLALALFRQTVRDAKYLLIFLACFRDVSLKNVV
jgi:hypothetical protein